MKCIVQDQERELCWTSLVVQRLRLCTSTAGGTGSIPDQGTKIPHAAQRGKKKKKKKRKEKELCQAPPKPSHMPLPSYNPPPSHE